MTEHFYHYLFFSPQVVPEQVIDICSGQHPVIDCIQQYVPNDTELNVSNFIYSVHVHALNAWQERAVSGDHLSDYPANGLLSFVWEAICFPSAYNIIFIHEHGQLYHFLYL